MYSIVWQISGLLFVLFPRETEMQQPVITVAPSNPTEVLEGKNITLEWRYNLSGRPLILMRLTRTDPFRILVQKNGNSLLIGDSRLQANVTDAFSSISFVGVVRDDDDDYQLEIQNDDIANNPVARNEITLRVLFPPSFNSFSSEQVVVESDPGTITLSCSADGYPTPNVTWTRVFDNRSDSDLLFTGNPYVINRNRNSAGTYRCKADNGIGAINQTIRVTVNFKPENVQLNVSDSNICKGDVFNISCSADGNPAVHTYLLFENDTLLNTSGSSVVHVTRTTSAAGVLVYRCEANNTVGTANATTTITVNEAPVIQALTNITVIEGENSNLTCHVSGIPVPSVSWTEVRTSDRTEGNIRVLLNVSRSDAGEYKCEASNFCGNDSNSTFVIVHFKPEGVQLTTNVTANKACLNDVVFFNCSAANANPPVALYQFFENDVLFGSNSSGEFSKIVMNSGNLTYKCVANNTAGTTSSQNVSITVNVPASIQSIEDQFVIESRNTSLICDASGTPRPTVFWINVASGQRTNSSVLAFTNINRSEAGEYRCEASNDCGSAVEAVNVTVQYPPENVLLTTNATANKACQNDVVSFTCSADAVPSAMPFQLFKDNVSTEISDSGKWVKTLSQGGMFDYKCVANNSIGSASSTNVNITVNVPSTIHPLQNKTITEGGNLNLSCNASGTPPPVVSWVRISTGQRFDGRVLQLTNINRSEARDYRCEASNECGNASEAQNIDVQYKPENVQLTTNASANKACQNAILKLNCSVGDANPEVTSYQLFRNGTDVGESNTRMWVKTLSNSGISMYKCVANNSVGSSESPSVSITVNVPPTIASILDKTVNETDNLTLPCVATGVPSPFVSWVKVSGGLRTNGSLLQLTNISRSQAGEYRCEASNECGNAVETVNITVPFKPENVRLVATNIGDEACQDDSVSLSCLADASPPVSSYQFFENDVLLGSNNSGMWTTSLSSSGILIYRCVASNLVGVANSANVSINVGVPSSIQSVQNATLDEGASRNLTCNASGIPPPTVAWIEEGSGQRTPGNVLRLIDIYRNQSGEYRCEASNRCGNKSVTTFVDVLYPPVITHISNNQTLNAGSSVTLNCSADGNPPPVISWTRVSDNSAVVFPLTDIGLQHEGTYRCTANNSVGSVVTGDVSIVVHFPASIEPLNDLTVTKGQTISLFCNVSGQPAPSVSWTHVNTSREFSDATWNITIIDERNLGNYRCDASNVYGNASITISVLFSGGLCVDRCSNSRKCRKLGDFYSCLCEQRKKGPNCKDAEPLVNTVEIRFTFSQQYKPVYDNLEADETKNLTNQIVNATKEEYNSQGFEVERVIVSKLSQGSVIADLEVQFKNEVSESEIRELTKKITGDGKLGQLSVDDVSVGPTTQAPEEKEECNMFFEGDDCKKGKPALIALVAVAALALVGLIVAIIACSLHKKKRGAQSISNGEYVQRHDPEGRGGTGDRNYSNGKTYYGNENRGYDQERPDATPMVTFTPNPAQTPGIAVNDSSVTKKAQPGEGTYADLGEFHQKSAAPTGPVKRPPAYEETPYAEITQFLQGPVDTNEEETPQEEQVAATKQDDKGDDGDEVENAEPTPGLYPPLEYADSPEEQTSQQFVVSI